MSENVVCQKYFIVSCHCKFRNNDMKRRCSLTWWWLYKMLKRKIEIFGKCWGVWRRAHYEGSIRFYRWENSKSSSSSDCKYISNICTNLSKIDLLHIAELSRFGSWLPKRLTISYKSILVSHIKVTLMNNSYAAWYRLILKLLWTGETW